MIYLYLFTIATGNLLLGYWYGKRVKSRELDEELFGEKHQAIPSESDSDDNWDDVPDDDLEQEVLNEAAELQKILSDAVTFREALVSIEKTLTEEGTAEQASEQANRFVEAGEAFLSHVEDVLATLDPADDDSDEVSRDKIQTRGKIERDAASVRSHAMEVRSLAGMDDSAAVASALNDAIAEVKQLPH